MDVGGWLRGLGLGRYEAAFRENEIDETVLPSLTEEHLKQLGVTALGHRVKLLDAIAALLRSGADAKAPTAEASSTLPKPAQDTAERRQVTVMFSLVGSTALSAPSSAAIIARDALFCGLEAKARAGRGALFLALGWVAIAGADLPAGFPLPLYSKWRCA